MPKTERSVVTVLIIISSIRVIECTVLKLVNGKMQALFLFHVPHVYRPPANGCQEEGKARHIYGVIIAQQVAEPVLQVVIGKGKEKYAEEERESSGQAHY